MPRLVNPETIVSMSFAALQPQPTAELVPNALLEPLSRARGNCSHAILVIKRHPNRESFRIPAVGPKAGGRPHRIEPRSALVRFTRPEIRRENTLQLAAPRIAATSARLMLGLIRAAFAGVIDVCGSSSHTHTPSIRSAASRPTWKMRRRVMAVRASILGGQDAMPIAYPTLLETPNRKNGQEAHRRYGKPR